jgi:hypothetical protein
MVNLRGTIYALKCEDHVNVKTHINTLNNMKEQLQLMGDLINDQIEKLL